MILPPLVFPAAILGVMEPHYALFLCAVKMQKPFSFVTNQCRPSDVQIKNCKESRLPVNWTDQGILKGESMIVLLTSCLTGWD